jgi:hypothetical protein
MTAAPRTRKGCKTKMEIPRKEREIVLRRLAPIFD